MSETWSRFWKVSETFLRCISTNQYTSFGHYFLLDVGHGESFRNLNVGNLLVYFSLNSVAVLDSRVVIGLFVWVACHTEQASIATVAHVSAAYMYILKCSSSRSSDCCNRVKLAGQCIAFFIDNNNSITGRWIRMLACFYYSLISHSWELNVMIQTQLYM